MEIIVEIVDSDYLVDMVVVCMFIMMLKVDIYLTFLSGSSSE